MVIVTKLAYTNPTKTDDINSGFRGGNTWYNIGTGEGFVCINSQANDAVWQTYTFDKTFYESVFNKQLVDNDGDNSLNVDNRHLTDNSGSIVIDYETRYLYDSSDNIVVSLNQKLLGDETGQATIDWNNKKLYHSGSVLLEWDESLKFINVPEYTDNASAISGSLVVGNIYRTDDNLKIVH